MPQVRLLQPLDVAASRRLLDFCHERGVTVFTVTALYSSDEQRLRIERDIFDRLAPFSMGRRSLEQTVCHGPIDYGSSEVECWRFDALSLRLILELSGGSLASHTFGEPEDWTFYREGELFFAIVSHEAYAFLRLRDEEELEAFLRLGVRCHVQRPAPDNDSR